MNDRIKNAYKSVKLSEYEKQEMLGCIKNKEKKKSVYLHTRLDKRKVFWGIAAAVVAVTALVLAIVLLPGQNGDSKMTVQNTNQIPQKTEAVNTDQPQEVVFSRITLSINPSIEFRIDKDGIVIEVVGTNEDGIELLEGMDAAGLSLENATILVVNRLIEEGYITDSSIVKEITLTINSGEFEIDTLEMMSGIIKTAASAYDISVDVQRAESVNGVNIVLAGNENEPSPDPADQTPITLPEPDNALASVVAPEEIKKILFECGSDELGNIWLSGEEDVRHDFVRFICKDLKEVVMYGLAYFIDTGFIADPYEADTAIEYELRLSQSTEQTLKELYEVADMMIKESGMELEVTKQPYGASIYLDDMGKPPREAEYTMNEILNPLVLKERSLITQQQMQILKYVYTDEELVNFLGRPSRFKVMPNIVGLTEQRAIELVKEIGMVPKVEYFFNPMYHGETGTVNEQYMEAMGLYETGRTCTFAVQTERPDEPCIVDRFVPVDMTIWDYETYLMENDLVQAHRDLENIGMPPAMKEEKYGPISQIEYDMYNEALEKIGIELRYLMPGERDDYFRKEQPDEAQEMTGYPEPNK